MKSGLEWLLNSPDNDTLSGFETNANDALVVGTVLIIATCGKFIMLFKPADTSEGPTWS